MFNNVRTPFSLDTTSHVLLQHLQILMKPEMFTGPTDVSVCEREKSTFLPSSPPMIRPQPCPPGTDQTGSAEVSSIYSPRSLFSSALCPLTAAPEQTLSRALRSPLLFLFPCSHFLSQQTPFLSHAVPVSSPPLSSLLFLSQQCPSLLHQTFLLCILLHLLLMVSFGSPPF